jgi:hypothetical protein
LLKDVKALPGLGVVVVYVLAVDVKVSASLLFPEAHKRALESLTIVGRDL